MKEQKLMLFREIENNFYKKLNEIKIIHESNSPYMDDIQYPTYKMAFRDALEIIKYVFLKEIKNESV